MKTSRPALIALLLFFGLVFRPAHAQDFATLLEKARTYDLGQDAQAIIALEELILRESKDPEKSRRMARQLATELLRPEASAPLKQFIGRQLALIGTAGEVPALAGLLGDPHLSHVSRHALARISDPAADAALRGALAQAKGATLIGIIETIGNRQDPDAALALSQFLSSPLPAVQEAALLALAQLGSSEAGEALRKKAEAHSGLLPDNLSDACLISAARLTEDRQTADPLSKGRVQQADTEALSEQLLRLVLRKSAGAHFKAAALKALVLQPGKADVGLLIETLKRGTPELQRITAANVVPELSNLQQIDAVCSLFPQLPPDVQVIVLNAFGGVGSGTATIMTAVRDALKSQDGGVRLAAIACLASLGDSSDVETLVQIVTNGAMHEQERAMKTLGLMPDGEINSRLIRLLADADQKREPGLIAVLAKRQAREASPQFLELARTRTGMGGKGALQALGEVAGRDQLLPVIELMLTGGQDLREEAVQSVVSIARRAESETECSSVLAEKYRAGNLEPAAKLAVIRVLGRLGSAPGLPVILSALSDKDQELCKEAVVAASAWPDAKPSANLLKIVRESQDPSLRVLAFRGYLDVIEKDSQFTPDDKVRDYEAAMSLVQRDEEKQRVFSKLGQVASFSALNLVVKLGGHPAGEEATAAAVSIAGKVYAQNPGMARLIVKKIIETTQNEKRLAECREILNQIDRLEAAEIQKSNGWPTFRVVPINPESRFEAAAIVDINRDGRQDIYCGGFWYRAPDWTRRPVRQIAERDNYFLDFGAIPADVDGDGWVDIVSGSWHEKDVFWVRNHGKTGDPFETIKIDEPGNLETVIGVDINGDSRLDVLPNTVGSIHWYQYRRDPNIESGVRWVRHDLPGGTAGHGVGAGDVNGDGLIDIVTPKGWLEQPASAEAAWVWHEQFDLGSASVPILVHDVDQDGDADLVWGAGHGYGVFWLEQVPTVEKIQWHKHVIDTSWSQPHFFLLADLDGDGTDEIVTGKRYYAHNGKDPGEDHPLCIYSYRFNRATRKWSRQAIHEGGRVGFGISTMAGDIDKDGDIDLIAPGKSGLYLLENLGRK